jgi:hypothetical protein
MNLIDFILDTIFWFVVFWLVIKVWQKYLIAKNEILENQIKDLTQKVKDSVIHVEIEKHGEVFYLFEKDTRQFIAQGSNFDEVQKHCMSRFKNKAVVADEAQMEQLGFK